MDVAQNRASSNDTAAAADYASIERPPSRKAAASAAYINWPRCWAQLRLVWLPGLSQYPPSPAAVAAVTTAAAPAAAVTTEVAAAVTITAAALLTVTTTARVTAAVTAAAVTLKNSNSKH